MSSLLSPKIVSLLDRLFAAADQNDSAARERALAEVRRRGVPPSDAEMAHLLAEAYLLVANRAGRQGHGP